MTAVGLDKFKKDPVVLTEIPPVPDEKGEIVEVQVLKEGKIPEKVQVAVFDPDEFLGKWEQHQFGPQCPRCQVPMKFESIPGSGGENFNYYRCPTKCWDTKCCVACPGNEVESI